MSKSAATREEISQANWQIQQQVGSPYSPYLQSLFGFPKGAPNWMYDPNMAANYSPPHVRVLSDEELDKRYDKLTIDLEAKRLNHPA